MNHKLVWNFECTVDTPIPLASLTVIEKDILKWESRFFWPAKEQITLQATDNFMLDLNHYEHKYKEDYYYLVPDRNYNIKRRRNELIYKPIIKQTPQALGFGSKINLEEVPLELKNSPDLEDILNRNLDAATVASVQKESYIYKFSTTPTIKLELARIEINSDVYFSACIEGRSAKLVQNISEHLLGEAISCDYVTFIKKISKHV